MRNPHQTDTTAIELLPRYDGPDVPTLWTGKHSKHNDENQSPRRTGWRAWDWHEIAYAAILVACCVPVVVLAALAPELSRKMAWNGCLSSVYRTLRAFGTLCVSPVKHLKVETDDANAAQAHFFTITIPFTGPGKSFCSTSDWQDESACIGYAFAQAKVIDLAWDVLLGRGSQVLLVWVACRLFRRVLDALMQRGEIGFDLFESLAFTPGTIRSTIMLCKHSLGWTPLPKTRHAKILYAGMAMATVYIVALPTLLSGMTGYASYFVPYMNIYNPDLFAQLNSSLITNTNGIQYVNCLGQVYPLWGDLGLYATPETGPGNTVGGYIFMDYKDTSWYDWPDYYQRYEDSIYSQCPRDVNITSCPAANVTTYVLPTQPGSNQQTIVAPAPGIVTWPDSIAGHTSHWLCNDQVFNTSSIVTMDQAPFPGQVAGTCQAGSGYIWGFSFLFTFLTTVLTLLFAVLMYAMWLDVRRSSQIEGKYGSLKDAMIISAQARQRLGEESRDWSARTLTEKVTNGKVGMLADAEMARRRRTVERMARRLSGASFGDPGRGDWGGDVIEDDRHLS